MDLLGRVLARWHLSEQGYFVASDLACQRPDTEDGLVFRFDIAGVRLKNGKAVNAVVGALRSWWYPNAYLTPSLVKAHILPGLAESLSDDAVESFRACLDLGMAPVDKLLFFSHASPEKSEEAEEILRAQGIETIYLERVASQLISQPSNRAIHSDPLIMQVMGLLRGALRGSEVKEPGEVIEKPAAPEPVASPQLQLPIFESRVTAGEE
jgi:hypothetical protein